MQKGMLLIYNKLKHRFLMPLVIKKRRRRFFSNSHQKRPHVARPYARSQRLAGIRKFNNASHSSGDVTGTWQATFANAAFAR